MIPPYNVELLGYIGIMDNKHGTKMIVFAHSMIAFSLHLLWRSIAVPDAKALYNRQTTGHATKDTWRQSGPLVNIDVCMKQ